MKRQTTAGPRKDAVAQIQHWNIDKEQGRQTQVELNSKAANELTKTPEGGSPETAIPLVTTEVNSATEFTTGVEEVFEEIEEIMVIMVLMVSQGSREHVEILVYRVKQGVKDQGAKEVPVENQVNGVNPGLEVTLANLVLTIIFKVQKELTETQEDRENQEKMALKENLAITAQRVNKEFPVNQATQGKVESREYRDQRVCLDHLGHKVSKVYRDLREQQVLLALQVLLQMLDLKGEIGDPGEKGDIGIPGRRGLPGIDGADGYGSPGVKGEKWIQKMGMRKPRKYMQDLGEEPAMSPRPSDLTSLIDRGLDTMTLEVPSNSNILLWKCIWTARWIAVKGEKKIKKKIYKSSAERV
ncbi:unnamed protein product [Ranitomeya imitator]|uniref:Uncharacterized protein n=1 Tax=Ranitomeya imitator TaxID=111125 RepID=A0ABN9L485_9NEOB|nr:unnamed protein product [Ranitomeya imitator]